MPVALTLALNMGVSATSANTGGADIVPSIVQKQEEQVNDQQWPRLRALR